MTPSIPRFYLFSFLLCISLLLALPKLPLAEASQGDQLSSDIQTLIEASPLQRLNLPWDGVAETAVKQTLTEIYSKRNFSPFWISQGKPNQSAEEIRQTIKGSFADGLEPEDYFLSRLNKFWSSSESNYLAKLEITLTIASAKLLSDLKSGRYRFRRADQESFPEVKPYDPNSVKNFESLLHSDSIPKNIKDAFPQHRQYLRMKSALAEYRKIAASGLWQKIPEKVPLLLGTRGPAVQQLKLNLKQTGDLALLTNQDEFDLDLQVAVKLFQQRHGLPSSGEVHKLTLAELNTPIEERIDTLLLNLERWRWLAPVFSEEKAVFVNIAGYELFAIKGPEIALRMAVIIGKSFTQTPVFADQIEYIEFNPYWNVPDSISAQEILPKLKKNRNYLAAEHMNLYSWRAGEADQISPDSIDWSNTSPAEMKRYLIKQIPGPWNVLGTLKFVFPNQFSVYLHDTSSPGLFKERERAFSHGCIRVSDPKSLAVFLLDSAKERWDKDRVESVIALGENKNIRLPSPVPIQIVYRTAWVDLDGSVNFRADLYSRDKNLKALL